MTVAENVTSKQDGTTSY